MKVFIAAAFGVALKSANTGAEVTIMDIPNSSGRAVHSVLSTVRRLKARNLASASRIRRKKQTAASLLAFRWRKEDLRTSECSRAIIVKQENKLFDLKLTQLYPTLKEYPQL